MAVSFVTAVYAKMLVENACEAATMVWADMCCGLNPTQAQILKINSQRYCQQGTILLIAEASGLYGSQAAYPQ